MKKGLTELVFILDRSGSMQGLEEDTIGGFNAMISKQREEEGEALVSVVLFSNDTHVLLDRVPLMKVEPLTRKDYQVGGGTALLDAVGKSLRHIGNVHKYAREEDVPEHTLFVITTDGMENCSRWFNSHEVREMIERQKTRYGWEFLYLGANLDAAQSAASIGISRDRAVEYWADSEGTRLNYEVLSCAVSAMRADGSIEKDWDERIREDRQRRGRRR